MFITKLSNEPCLGVKHDARMKGYVEENNLFDAFVAYQEACIHMNTAFAKNFQILNKVDQTPQILEEFRLANKMCSDSVKAKFEIYSKARDDLGPKSAFKLR